MIFLAWLMSSHKRKIPWRVIFGGLGLQFLLAIFILWTPPGKFVFGAADTFFRELLGYVESGSSFVFGVAPDEADNLPDPLLLRTFAFGVLPTIIFFSSPMSVLYWLGVVQWVVRWMAVVMRWTLNTSAAWLPIVLPISRSLASGRCSAAPSSAA